MDYRMERTQASDRVAYILYSDRMAYLATLSWLKGRLVYEYQSPDATVLIDIPARNFEEYAKKLDEGEQS